MWRKTEIPFRKNSPPSTRGAGVFFFLPFISPLSDCCFSVSEKKKIRIYIYKLYENVRYVRTPLFHSYSSLGTRKSSRSAKKKAKIYYENERISHIYIIHTPSPLDPAGASINLRPSQRMQDTVVLVSSIFVLF